MSIIPQTNYSTYLTSSISASDTTIPVATCPAAGVTTGFVRIDDEVIKFGGNSNPGGAGNLTSCVRGLALSGVSEATASLGVAHQSGVAVRMTDVHYYMSNASPSILYLDRSNAFSLSTGLTRYLDAYSGDPTEANVGILIPSAGYIKNLNIAMVTNTLDGSTVFTLMKNGVAQTVTVTITAGSTTTGSDTTNSFTVAAGDRLSLRAVAAGSSGAINFYFSFEKI